MSAEQKYRSEKDTFGPLQVPAERYWGAQTQRSLMNFDIGALVFVSIPDARWTD